jgi:hypothetical protein
LATWKDVSILFAKSNPQQAHSSNAIKIHFKSLTKAKKQRVSNPRTMNPRATNPRATNPRTTNPRATNPRTTNPRATNPRTTNPRAAKSRSILPKDQPWGLGLYAWNQEHNCYEEFPATHTQGSVSSGMADCIPQSTGLESASAWEPRNPADTGYVLPYPSEIIDHLHRLHVQTDASNNINAAPVSLLPPTALKLHQCNETSLSLH